jgi:prepilin-type N-terminal cleavage/methylation domain-containing protein
MTSHHSSHHSSHHMPHPERARTGFTLIELLIVVVIIGLLASFAVPRFANVKGKAYASAMRSDLHSLALAQENYAVQTNEYTNALANLDMKASQGVTITISEATISGWSATATHASTSATCAVFSGAALPVGPAMLEGAVTCRD